MSQALENSLILLNLEETEGGLFRGQNEDLGLRRVFSGRVVGQALYAVKGAVPEGRLVHPFHSYFLHPGDNKKPIIYDVETLCDGSSFSARRVAVTQNGKPIFYMTASFQAPEAGLEHQKTTPSASAPDGLSPETQIVQSLAHLLPPVPKDKSIRDRSLEVRPVEFHGPLKGRIAEPHRQVWTRANGSVLDDLRTHQYLPGHASDLNFLSVALQPHGIGSLESGIQIVTIDHSMWFHRPLNLDEWLLYSMESTSASSTRGFVCGEFYTQGGVLVASTVRKRATRNHN